MLCCEVLVYLVIRLRHLLFLGRPSWRPPRLLVLGELGLHQLRLLRLQEILHLHSKGGELCNRLPSLLHIPLADVLLLEPSGESPDFLAAGDPVTPLHVLHGEERVMFHAHVVETKVHRGAIRRGRQHRLGHDAWDVELVTRCSLETFRFNCASLFAFILPFGNIRSS